MNLAQADAEARSRVVRRPRRRKVKAAQAEMPFAGDSFALIAERAPATEFVPPVSRAEAADLFAQIKYSL